MKYNEFHRMVVRNGWIPIRQKGSHVIYEKDGKRYPVPNHGSKELPKPTELKMRKELGF